jgi:hypothetical protein
VQVKANTSLIERQRACEQKTNLLLDQAAIAAYDSRLSEDCLTYHSLTPQERREMTVILLRHLIDWEAFEFIAESGDNTQSLPLALADFIAAKDSDQADIAHNAFRKLQHHALLYAESAINRALSRIYVSRKAA